MKVYFLGAGATIAVAPKAPLNDNLLEVAFGDASYAEVQEEKDLIQEFSSKIFFNGDRTKMPRPEDILSFIDYNLHKKTFYLKDYSYEDLKMIRNAIDRIIAVVLKTTLTNLKSNITDKFVRKLTPQDVIISTNYDIVADNALFNELKNTNYGSRLRKNILPVPGAGNTVRAGNMPFLANINEGKIPLLKIHGSLNWLYCPKCDEIDITIGQKGAADYLGNGYDLRCVFRTLVPTYSGILSPAIPVTRPH